MRIFISHSHRDSDIVRRIATRLQDAGHDVWLDSLQIEIGDNIQEKVRQGLEAADALIVVVSENSFRSRWVQVEFSAIAFQDISKRKRRIIPIKIDGSSVPSYLADRLYLDLSQNFDAGLERLLQSLRAATPESPVQQPEVVRTNTQARTAHIQKLRDALRRGRLSLVCGAGVSVAAGIPAWGDLLVRLIETMVERLSTDQPLTLAKREAALEFQKRYGASSLILGKYLKNNLGRDFQSNMRDALYASQQATSPLIDSIVGLSRPQRDAKPLDSIVTFNFDSLIEEQLTIHKIPNRPIFSELIKHESNELPIYHVHGYLPRTGPIPDNNELVFSEDAYHSQFIDPFSWSNLILLNKLTQNTCLFIGISLTDPNMRRLLDVAWRKNPEKTLGHYILKRVPRFSDGDVLDRISRMLEEQDANALGLNVIWFDEFAELPEVLNDIAQERGA